MTGVTIQNLSKKFGNKNVVEDVTFEAEKGTVVVVLGPSGCGKTTTLRCIAGLEEPSSGIIQIDDQLMYSHNEPRVNVPPDKRNIGMVFQSFALWPHMTVADNVSLGLQVRGVSSAEIRQRVSRIVDIVGLGGFDSKYPGQLSGGQQQRVALARSLVYEPSVLLLDEPLTSLDAKLRADAIDEIKRIQRRLGITTLWVTHDQIEAMAMADKAVIMDQGHKVDEGNPRDVYLNPKSPFSAAFLGTVNCLTGKVVTKDGHLSQIAIDRTELEVPISLKEHTMTGKGVLLFVKAERIKLARADKSAFVIELSEFLGDRYKYSVSNGSQLFIVYSLDSFSVGETVALQLDPNGMSVFETNPSNGGAFKRVVVGY